MVQGQSLKILINCTFSVTVHFFQGHAIGCYTCVSKNNDNEACDKGWSSAGFTRDCRTEAGQQANYCFKIEGQGSTWFVYVA